VTGATDDAGPDESRPDERLEDAVRAMGHPGRRAMLSSARDGERTASELADAAGLSPSAASQHLRQLREAGLMVVRVDARRRLYHVDLARLAQVRAVLDSVWADRLDALAARAEADADVSRTDPAAADDAGLAG
jgi:DNA-binding transcriptional ArsR family regulator